MFLVSCARRENILRADRRILGKQDENQDGCDKRKNSKHTSPGVSHSISHCFIVKNFSDQHLRES